MGKHWTEVKDEIEREIDKVYYDIPPEIYLATKGVFPSGATTGGQAFASLTWMFADSHAISALVFSAPMYDFLGRDDFTLDQCKHIFYVFNENKTRLMGGCYKNGVKQKVGAWLNFPKFYIFFTDIVESYDTIQTKEEFKDLLFSWFNYVDRMNRWMYVVYPWEVVGQMMPALSGDDIPKELIPMCKEALLME